MTDGKLKEILVPIAEEAGDEYWNYGQKIAGVYERTQEGEVTKVLDTANIELLEAMLKVNQASLEIITPIIEWRNKWFGASK